MTKQFLYNQNELVYITKGKFKNICGSIMGFNGRERDKTTRQKYYNLFVRFKVRYGKYNYSLNDCGLGLVLNIPEEELKIYNGK